MKEKQKFSHVDGDGKATMVDVGNKPVQSRKAIASGKILLAGETIKLIRENKMTMLIVTHSQDIASRADRILTLKNGHLLENE